MKFFVIGLGSIGARHARNLLTLGHTVWGYDKSLEVSLQAKEQIPGLEIAADFFDCDACVICTPPDQHIAEIINAIEAGKHIFVEKPIGVPQDIEPLGKLLDEAKRKNLVVMVGNNLRFSQCVMFAREIITAGGIGLPLWASFTVAQENTKYKDHVLLNWLSHECDLALHLLGPAGLKSCVGTESITDMVLQHKAGAQSTIHGDYLTHPHRRFFTVQGTNGFLDCNVEIDTAAAYKSDGTLLERKMTKELYRWPDHTYVDEMKEFIRLIERGKPEFAASGDEGLTTLRLINDAANASASKASVHV